MFSGARLQSEIVTDASPSWPSAAARTAASEPTVAELAAGAVQPVVTAVFGGTADVPAIAPAASFEFAVANWLGEIGDAIAWRLLGRSAARLDSDDPAFAGQGGVGRGSSSSQGSAKRGFIAVGGQVGIDDFAIAQATGTDTGSTGGNAQGGGTTTEAPAGTGTTPTDQTKPDQTKPGQTKPGQSSIEDFSGSAKAAGPDLTKSQEQDLILRGWK